MQSTSPTWQNLQTDWNRFTAWLFQKRHKAFARLVSWRLLKAFTGHPHQTNETYLEHLWFTTTMSTRFCIVGITLFTHGVFPFLFTRTASNQIERIYAIMKSRASKVRRDGAMLDFDI